MDENTLRVAFVHDIQVFEDFSSLMGEKDKKVSIIVMPEGAYRTG